LQILFGKCCYLPTPKTIWGGEKKGISKFLAILTWQKKNSAGSVINEEASGCQLTYKSVHMQYAMPILDMHKCQKRRRICQLGISAKLNCQTVGVRQGFYKDNVQPCSYSVIKLETHIYACNHKFTLGDKYQL